MNRNGIIGGIIILLIVVAGVVFFTMGKTSGPVVGTIGTTSQGSLRDLFIKGGSEQCSVSNTSGTATSSGTVYIGLGEMRGDFTSTTDGKTTQSHIVVLGGTSYVWTDAFPQGFKMSFSASTTSAQSGQGVDATAPMNYSCQSWTPESSQFTLPANITFQDVTAMNTSTGAGAAAETTTVGKGTAAQCSACNQISDPQGRAQCLLALSC